MIYSALKESLFEGPADAVMMEEFDHKSFFLDPGFTKKKRYNIYSLRYDLAICYGLHGTGSALALSHMHEFHQGTASIPFIMIFVQKLTEGLSIGAPIARMNFDLKRFMFLGSIAGIPYVMGFVLTGFAISLNIKILILSFAAGSLFYCLVMLAQMVYMTHRADKNPLYKISVIMAGFAAFSLLH